MSPIPFLNRRAAPTLLLFTLLAACDEPSPPAGADLAPTGATAEADAQGDGDRVHGAYDAGTYERLARVKQRYDRENFFRMNQNITPTA